MMDMVENNEEENSSRERKTGENNYLLEIQRTVDELIANAEQ
jgi:hypothetical protein